MLCNILLCLISYNSPVIVRSVIHVWLFATPWTQHTRLPCSSQSPGAGSNSRPLSQWCHPTISSSVTPSPALNLSQHQGLFQWVGSLHQVVKYWSFSFSIRTSNEYSGLISFRMDWLDLLAVQGTLKSFLQHHSSKASILCTQLSLQSNSHIHTWLLEKP